jgi:hypothetical protein
MTLETLNFEPRKSLAIPKLRLGVPRVMPLYAFWQQALAAPLTPPCQSGASTFAFHAGAESVLTFARAFRWLIGAFHIRKKLSGLAKVEIRALLST